MAGDTTSDVFVPSAYMNEFIVYPEAVSHPQKAVNDDQFGTAVTGFFYLGASTMDKPYWEGKHYSYFSNKECEYFPCHKGANPDDFNCLFCYCPLYALGDKCGGNFSLTDKGFKDCTNCMLPHKKKNYGYVTGKYSELAELMRKMREKQE